MQKEIQEIFERTTPDLRIHLHQQAQLSKAFETIDTLYSILSGVIPQKATSSIRHLDR